MQKVDPDNDLSPRYIDMDGQNLSVGSTGTRLLMTILGIFMDERFDTLLIDEPELGLSPKIQMILANFLQDIGLREKYFPHLKRIFIATHSHLFLDRSNIRNNFIVTKEGLQISLNQIADISDFHRLQFNLLGNTFEAMFFPSAIVIVEGKTDHEYLERVIDLHVPGRKITVVPSNGGDIKRKVYSLRETLGDLTKSPLRNRLFIVVDIVHQKGLKLDLVNLGVLEENIVIWQKNGIEYYYPPSILSNIFSCSPSEIDYLDISGDRVSLNGIVKTKNELCEEVVKNMDRTTILPSEIDSFVQLLKEVIE